jgi:putative ABC transport system permease protein
MMQFPNINAWIVVRSHGAPESVAQAVQAAVSRVDRDLAVANVTTMETVVAESMWRPRFAAFLLAIFAAMALLLAAAGIYALMSYSVSQRVHEMGLRITLGAAPRAILGLIVGHAARLALGGVVLGLAASLALRTILASQLFGVSASDPFTMAAVTALLVAVALAASAVPALRAVRADPVAALRHS